MKRKYITKYSHLKRYKQIAEVLIKYGFDFVAQELMNRGYIPKYLYCIKQVKHKYTSGERLRLAFEELGPTFIKLGQIMSTRRDIFPEDVIDELAKLQDNVLPFTFAEAKEVFEAEMKRTIEDSFSNFNSIPIASASIGQVYHARLKTGEEVVVKIQRPKIKTIIERDLEILFNLAKIIDKRSREYNPLPLTDVIDEFTYTIIRELDYTFEARNAEKFSEYFSKDDKVQIPGIYWEYTTKKVLTMEKINGVKIIDYIELEKQGWDLKKLATIGAHSFLKQVFIFGFFHGDPHPGNLFALKENRIAYVDFGIVGFLDRGSLKMITDIFTAAARKDVEKIVNTLMEVEAINPETNLRRLREDISLMINMYYNMPLKRLNISDALKQCMEVAYTNNIKLPSQFIILLKALITLEGSGKYLHPDFSLSDIAKDFVKEIYLNKFHPKNLFGDIRDYYEEIFDSFKYLPKQIRNFLKKLENNKIQLNIEISHFDFIVRELSNIADLFSLSMISSALIIGSSIIIYSDHKPQIYGLTSLGFIGYAVAAVLSASIIFSVIFKRLKRK